MEVLVFLATHLTMAICIITILKVALIKKKQLWLPAKRPKIKDRLRSERAKIKPVNTIIDHSNLVHII